MAVQILGERVVSIPLSRSHNKHVSNQKHIHNGTRTIFHANLACSFQELSSSAVGAWAWLPRMYICSSIYPQVSADHVQHCNSAGGLRKTAELCMNILVSEVHKQENARQYRP